MKMDADQVQKSKDFGKICNFYEGEKHFLTTSVFYLLQKISSGSKVILFANKKIKDVICEWYYEGNKKIGYGYSKKNLVLYPLDIIKKIKDNEYFSVYAKEIIKKMNENLANQDIIFCIQRANDLDNGSLKELYAWLSKIKKPIKIINCYEFMRDTNKMNQVIRKHTHILNTNGVFKIDNFLV
jgi:hypothetical protein